MSMTMRGPDTLTSWFFPNLSAKYLRLGPPGRVFYCKALML